MKKERKKIDSDIENEMHLRAKRGQTWPNLTLPQTRDRRWEIEGRQNEELKTSEELIFLKKIKW